MRVLSISIGVTFSALLSLGFLATPDVCKFVLPNYLLALHEHGGPLRDLQQKIDKISEKIPELESKAARLATEATLEKDIDKKQKLAADATLATFDKEALLLQKKEFKNLYSEKINKLKESAIDSANLSLVVRALALGAVGALFSILAKDLAAVSAGPRVPDKHLRKVWASMAVGAIVAVVIIGLFKTGFISIFTEAEKAAGTPDFWKVTILSLFAGAFADRLFQAAAHRMEGYVGQIENTKSGTKPKATV